MATNTTATKELAEAERARLLRKSLALPVGILALVVSLWPSPSPAGELRCANHKLSIQDTERLAVTAGAKTPAGVTFSVAYPPCNNADFAYASFESSRRALPDGVTAWWTLDCSRRLKLWTCDEPRYWREAETSVVIQGVARRVHSTFDAATSLEVARPLIAPAAELLYGNPETPPPACRPGKGDDALWRRLKGTSEPPPPPELIEIPVRTEAGTLTFGDFSLVVSYSVVAGNADADAACWSFIAFVA